MHHNLKICVAEELDGGIVRCRTVTLRERLLRAVLGEQRKITVIVPGGSVKELDIQELPEVDDHECA